MISTTVSPSAPGHLSKVPVIAIPDWITSNARELAPGISVRRDADVVVLALRTKSGSSAEFEINPALLENAGASSMLFDANPTSAEQLAASLSDELKTKDITLTNAFRACCESGYSIRTLTATAKNAHFEANLSPNAVIHADFTDSIVSLTGSTAAATELSFKGSSVFDAHFDELKILGVIQTSPETLLSGRIGTLSFEGNGSKIQGYAEYLSIDAIKNRSSDQVREIFKGLCFSVDRIKPELFKNSIALLDAVQVKDKQITLNATFVKDHIIQLQNKPLELAVSCGVLNSTVVKSNIPHESNKANVVPAHIVSLGWPAGVDVPKFTCSATQVIVDKPKLALVLSDDGTQRSVFGWAMKVKEADVVHDQFHELQDLGPDFPLYAYAMMYAFSFYRGKNLKLFQQLVSAGNRAQVV